MRLTILTAGSRGDVEPFVALGAGMARAGHRVRLATHPVFSGLVADHGLEFASIGLDPHAIMSEVMPYWEEAKRRPLRLARKLISLVGPLTTDFFARCLAACEGSDALLFSPYGTAAWHLAERLGIPSAQGMLQPAEPTRAFPSPLAPPALGRFRPLCRTTHTAGERVGWIVSRPIVDRWRRRDLGLPPLGLLRTPQGEMRRTRLTTLHGYSEAVSPRAPDWGETTHVTGYWFLDDGAGWQPPEPLARFLDAGPPPVLVGFGSTFGHDAAALARTVLEALRLAGVRGILMTTHGALAGTDLPDTVFALEEAPYGALLPLTCAAVHHGGAGSTAASLRAGRPTVTVPSFFDQPFWGDRVARLGAGPPPIPLKRLTAERLAAALRSATTDVGMRARAAEVGRAIRAEDGVARAVGILERVLAR